MLRASSYTIYVDLPERPDEMLLVHGLTGACDKVARPVGAFLRRMEAKTALPENGFQPNSSTLSVLERRGYLTTRTAEGEQALMARLSEALEERSRERKPNVVLMPTYGCNLRCPYCFQAHVRTGTAAATPLKTMTPELVDRIFDTIPILDERHGLVTEEIETRGYLFYGGEPFLRSSRPIVDYIVGKARAFSPCTFSAITNGTELDAYEDLLGPEGLTFVQITLDGAPATHDRRRIYEDGRGSFAQISRNVDLCLDREVMVSLRINVDHTNLEELPLLAEEIVRSGWNTRSKFSAYLAPVHGGAGSVEAEGGAGGLDGDDVYTSSWRLMERLDELRETHEVMGAIEGPSGSIRARAESVLRESADPFKVFTPKHCTAQSTTYIFDPDGDVFSCFDEPGHPDRRIGRLGDDGALVFEPVEEEWRGRSVRNTAKCIRCRYAMFCGGGCAQGSMREGRGLHGSHCDALPRFFRRAAAEAYEALAKSRVHAADPAPECVR